ENKTFSYIKDTGVLTMGVWDNTYNFWMNYTVNLPYGTSFLEDENHIYVTCEQRGLFILEKVEDASPIILSEADTPGSAYDVAVQGNYAYIADKHMGLSVIDISDKTNPQFLYNYSDTWGHARSIVANDKIVAIGSGGGGIYVFSIENNPAEPELVLQVDSDEIGYNYGVKIHNGVLYAISRDLGIVQIELDYE
ncbi:MAG: hypothetical protein U9N34_07000, partial [Candidatus Cloacimonadota bacterium]|nr:hypothetical protein [Candidatus Cloacimonadota bacterium]